MAGGDGKTSPFGAGGGKGAPASGGKFDPTTGRGTDAPGRAPPFDQHAQRNPQPSMQQVRGVELGGASGEPPGGLLPFNDADKNVNPVRAREIGVGTVGDSRVPFRLTGGSK